MINRGIGVIICLVTLFIAKTISNYVGIIIFGLSKSPISPIIIAILIGLIISNSFKSITAYSDGFNFCSNYLLKLGIILLGIRLSLSDIALYGLKGIIVIIPCIIMAIISARTLHKYFNVSDKLSLLVAVGTSICGATAIMALAPLIKAKKEEISYAIANITIFGLFAMFLYPIIANLLFNNYSLATGLFLGSSIHETAQVTGSAMIYAGQYSNPSVLEIATVIKLVRNTAMVVVLPFLAHLFFKNEIHNNIKVSTNSIFPYFIIGFIIFGLIRTLGDYYEYIIGNILWENIIYFIKWLAENFLIVAMASIGFNTKIDKFKKLGMSPFYLRFIVAVIVGIVSISTIYIMV